MDCLGGGKAGSLLLARPGCPAWGRPYPPQGCRPPHGGAAERHLFHRVPQLLALGALALDDLVSPLLLLATTGLLKQGQPLTQLHDRHLPLQAVAGDLQEDRGRERPQVGSQVRPFPAGPGPWLSPCTGFIVLPEGHRPGPVPRRPPVLSVLFVWQCPPSGFSRLGPLRIPACAGTPQLGAWWGPHGTQPCLPSRDLGVQAESLSDSAQPRTRPTHPGPSPRASLASCAASHTGPRGLQPVQHPCHPSSAPATRASWVPAAPSTRKSVKLPGWPPGVPEASLDRVLQHSAQEAAGREWPGGPQLGSRPPSALVGIVGAPSAGRQAQEDAGKLPCWRALDGHRPWAAASPGSGPPACPCAWAETPGLAAGR